jgi:hypothetical protein
LVVFFSLRRHIDFETVIKRDLEEPICVTEFSQELPVDFLPGVRNRETLQFSPETGLKEVKHMGQNCCRSVTERVRTVGRFLGIQS